MKDEPRAEVLHGGWAQPLAGASYDLIFADCASSKRDMAHLDALVGALKRGGLLVLGNFSPPAFMSEALHGGDAARDALFAHPGLRCVELSVSVRERVIVGARMER